MTMNVRHTQLMNLKGRENYKNLQYIYRNFTLSLSCTPFTSPFFPLSPPPRPLPTPVAPSFVPTLCEVVVVTVETPPFGDGFCDTTVLVDVIFAVVLGDVGTDVRVLLIKFRADSLLELFEPLPIEDVVPTPGDLAGKVDRCAEEATGRVVAFVVGRVDLDPMELPFCVEGGDRTPGLYPLGFVADVARPAFLEPDRLILLFVFKEPGLGFTLVAAADTLVLRLVRVEFSVLGCQRFGDFPLSLLAELIEDDEEEALLEDCRLRLEPERELLLAAD